MESSRIRGPGRKFILMNLLKSIFISIFSLANTAILAVGVWMLLRRANPAAWFGVVIAAMPFSIVIGRIMFANRPRTKAHFPASAIIAIGGTLMAVFGWTAQGAEIVAPILAATALSGLLAYDFWYSKLKRGTASRITIGKALPDFVVKRVGGGILRPADLAGKPAILIFYRGNWCPLCMAQIRELAGEYNRLESLGVRVCLISPQPHTFSVDLAEKVGVNFEYFTDEDNMSARILGIESRNGIPIGMQLMGYSSHTVLPTVIITDAEGKVIWADQTDNYRVRPEPQTYFEVLRGAGVIENR